MIAAATAFMVTLCTALMAAFNQDSVVSFGDVHATTYGAAVLGALVAAIHAFQARNKPSPASASALILPLAFLALIMGMPGHSYAAGTAATSQTVTATWQAPTTREDGTPLAASEIASYRLYYAIGSTPTTSSPSVSITPGSATQGVVTLQLSPSTDPVTVNLAVTAVDTNGLESPLSNIASKTFLVKSTALPSAPTSVTFSVSCGTGCSISSQ